MTARRVFTRACLRSAALIVAACGACSLPPYPSGEITCDLGNVDARCPDGFACLDVHRDGHTVCVEIGCGDGVTQVSGDSPEQCDDANKNDLDTCGACAQATFTPSVAVGFGPGKASVSDASLGQPSAVAADRDGDVFVAAFGSNTVHRYDGRAGALTTFVGSGSIVDLGNGQSSAPNEVAVPIIGGLAADGQGNLFIADFFDNIIRRVDAVTGRVDTVVARRPADQLLGVATQATATTARPTALAVDGDGVLFFLDEDLPDPTLRESGRLVTRIRRLDPITGAMRTVHQGSLNHSPLGLGGMAFDDSGRLYALGDNGFILIIDGDRTFGARLPSVPECGAIIGIQRKIAVTPDGGSLFYASLGDVYRVDLDRSQGATVPHCIKLAGLPTGTQVDLPVVNAFSDPGPIDIGFQRDPSGGPGSVIAADPTNGVVWRIAPDQTDAFDAFIGVSADNGQQDFAGEVVVELALQTDARIGFNETPDCQDQVPPDAPRLDRKNLEVFGAFPDEHRIIQISCGDVINVVAGDGTRGNSDGDGDPLHAQLNNPVAAARAHNGNVYIADRDNDSIREVDNLHFGTTPTISTLISPHTAPIAGLHLARPSGLVADDSGRLIIADSGNGRIVRIDPETLEAEVLLADLLEPSALVFFPYGFSTDFLQFATACDVPRGTPTVDPCGMLIFAERGGHRVRGVALEPLLGVEFDLAGGPRAEPPAPGDRDAVTINGIVRSELRFPRGVMIDIPSSVIDSTGASLTKVNLLVVDGIDRLRRVTLDSFQLIPPTITTTVTTATALDANGVGLPSGDDAVDATGLLRGPVGSAAIDADHLLIVEKLTGRLRLLTLSTGGLVSVSGLPEGSAVSAAGVTAAAEAVPLEGASGLAYDAAAGVAWVSEAPRQRVRRFQIVDPQQPATWTTDVVPLQGNALHEPAGLTVDPTTGDVFIADRAAHVILRVDVAGTATVIAGQTLQRGFAGDGGAATQALLNAPENVLFVERAGRRLLYVADAGNERVRRVDLDTDSGVMTTVLGDGSAGSGGEGAPASSFPVFSPRGLAVDAAGNLLVTSGNAIRMVQADTFFDASNEPGVADGADAVATIYGAPPRANFPEDVTRCLSSLEIVPGASETQTRVLALDSCLGVLVVVDRSKTAPR